MEQIHPPANPQGIVDALRSCIKCGYNIKGLFAEGHCPECGTPVAQSLRGDLLQHAAGDYVKTILTGHSWVLNSILVSIILQIAGAFVGFSVGAAGGTAASREFTALAAFAALAVSVWGLLGYLKLTTPDPQFDGSSQPERARVIVRAVAYAQMGIRGMLAAFSAFSTPSAAMVLVLGGLNALAIVAFAIQFVAMMNYTRWLARRVPDAWIVRRAGMYRWLLPLVAVPGAILLMIGPLIALIMYWNLLDRMRKHLKSIVATGTPAALRGMAG